MSLAAADPALLSPTLKRLIGYGGQRPLDKWTEDRRILDETKEALLAAVEAYGMILLPTAPHLPHRLDEAPPADQADFTCLANIAGLPALSLPAGWSDDGRPAAVQLVGASRAEAALFAAAAALDAALSAYRRPPHFFEGAT
jgi:aspartyl-tRNA(Asn)/glutamyl-tRNA(Gln) amidotransferase subunit A